MLLTFTLLIVLAVGSSRAAMCGGGRMAACGNSDSNSNDDGFELHMLDTSGGALCLDGSPGGFYFRGGSGAGTPNTNCIDDLNTPQMRQSSSWKSRYRLLALLRSFAICPMHDVCLDFEGDRCI